MSPTLNVYLLQRREHFPFYMGLAWPGQKAGDSSLYPGNLLLPVHELQPILLLLHRITEDWAAKLHLAQRMILPKKGIALLAWSMLCHQLFANQHKGKGSALGQAKTLITIKWFRWVYGITFARSCVVLHQLT